MAGSCVFEPVVVACTASASQPEWMTGRLFRCLSTRSDGFSAWFDTSAFQPGSSKSSPISGTRASLRDRLGDDRVTWGFVCVHVCL